MKFACCMYHIVLEGLNYRLIHIGKKNLIALRNLCIELPEQRLAKLFKFPAKYVTLFVLREFSRVKRKKSTER